MIESYEPVAMEAGVSPEQFWNMTFAEMQATIGGYRDRIRWQAVQTYMLPGLINNALSDKKYPDIQKVFPGLFEDIPQLETKQPWQIMKEQILAHREDYKRNRGELN